MLPYRDSRFVRIALVIFFIIILGYAYYEARGALFGPSITVDPRVMETSTAFVKIQGTAQRIASLSLNGEAINVTEDGSFDEPYVLVPGYNRIVLSARDKYGKEAQRVIEIMYQGGATTSSAISSRSSTSTP